MDMPTHKPIYTSLKGIISPTEWDEQGKILSIALLMPEEKTVDILLDDASSELLNMHKSLVEIHGQFIFEHGIKIFKVNNFKLIKQFSS